MSLVRLRQKAANICEVQVNGGDIGAKVDFARGLFEQKVPVDAVFAKVSVLREVWPGSLRVKKHITSCFGYITISNVTDTSSVCQCMYKMICEAKF